MNPTIIYGAGCQGVSLFRLLQQRPDPPKIRCFIDGDRSKQGQTVEGLPVYFPEYLMSIPKEERFIAVAVGSHYPVVRRLLEKFDLQEEQHFFNATPRSLPYSDIDPVFKTLHEKVRRHTLVSEDRLAILYQLVGHARNVPGDLVEIGVYKGGSSLLMAEALQGSSQWLHLFDTFNGMPACDTSIDLHRSGDFADTTTQAVSELLKGFPKVRLYPGWFPDTLPPSWSNKSFSLIHVDVDIYTSALACCQFFYPRLNPGGMIIFDDYGFPSCPGVRKAVDEFCRLHNLQVLYLPSGQALLVHG